MINWLAVYIFINISLYAVSLVMLAVASEYKVFNLIIFGLAILLTLCISIYKKTELLKFLKSKLCRSIFSNLVNTFLVVSILGVINFLVVKNDFMVDFTKFKIHSLSGQSKKAVNLMGARKAEFILFAKREDWNKYLGLLQLYKNYNSKIQIKAIDVDQDPTMVSLYNVKENGTLVIEVEGQRHQAVINNELAVTNLLLRIFRPNKPKIYYVSGHKELDFEDKNNAGGNFLKEKILQSNFELIKHDLTQKVPSDANALLVLNPQYSFLESELLNLERYIKNGGGFFTTLSPQFNEIAIQNYYDFLAKLGVNFENILILDRLSAQQGAQASIPIVNSYDKDHDITKDMQERTLFPVSGALTVNDSAGFNWKVLAKSTPFPASWGERNFEEVKTGKAQFDDGVDLQGPLNILIAGDNGQARVVIGSSTSFILNQFQGQANNFNFFLNALSWVTRDESLISLDRPKLNGNLIYLSEMHITVIFYFSILFLPFTLFGIAIFTYRRRVNQ